MNNNFAHYFIGPHGENISSAQKLWSDILVSCQKQRTAIFAKDPNWNESLPDGGESEKILNEALSELQQRLNLEVPTFTKRYIGHMISDVSVPALLGHISVLLQNPNNASKEVAKVGTYLEMESINRLSQMVGYSVSDSRGHFTSCGTVANLEAVWRARYRMDHFLAMALCLAKRSKLDGRLFEAMHMGWDRFYKYKTENEISNKELVEYSATIKGPARIAQICSSMGIDYPLPALLVPSSCHYSWPKAVNLFGLGSDAILKIDTDKHGHLCLESLDETLQICQKQDRPILMVTSVAGSTEFGGIDPVHKVNQILQKYRPLEFWHHVDAAYGGFYCCLLDQPESSHLTPWVLESLNAIGLADSITIDPHKLGYVPYACGAILTKNPENYTVSHIEAPYLEKDQTAEFPCWSTTLEGSRSATGAGAVWLSSECMPLCSTGHGVVLKRGIRSRELLHRCLKKSVQDIYFTPSADTNILCFCLAKTGESLSAVNKRSQEIYGRFVKSPDFAVSKTVLKKSAYKKMIEFMVESFSGIVDAEELFVIRLVTMSPYSDDNEDTENIFQEFSNQLNQIWKNC